MAVVPGPVCLRPDGKVCGHEEKKHSLTHALMGGRFCIECWDGKELIGPYVHAYNPHLWTGAGWLPAEAQAWQKEGSDA